MAEYIKREALVDLVLGKLKFMGDARIMNKGDEKVLSEIDGYEKAIYAVHELLLDKDLIEDIQPVKRGKWVKSVVIPIDSPNLSMRYPFLPKNIVRARCANCLIFSNDLSQNEEMTLKYCPNCGAKMDLPDTTKG